MTRPTWSFNNTKLHLTEASEAFDTALATGRLTEIMGQPNYVGDYMYMGTHPKTGRAAFKHRDTREYLK